MGTETLLKFKLHRDSNKLPAYAYEVTVKKMILHVFRRCDVGRGDHQFPIVRPGFI